MPEEGRALKTEGSGKRDHQEGGCQGRYDDFLHFAPSRPAPRPQLDILSSTSPPRGLLRGFGRKKGTASGRCIRLMPTLAEVPCVTTYVEQTRERHLSWNS